MDDSPHISGFVQVNGVRLHYLDWGGNGPALVFLPGLGCSAHIYDRFAPRFCHRFHVLALTRRGHGESDYPPGGYDIETLTGDLRLFLDALGIDQTHLAGHSFANVELTHFATRHPQRTLSLVYLDAAFDRTAPSFRSMREQNPLLRLAAPDINNVYSSYAEYMRARMAASPSHQIIWGDLIEREIYVNTAINAAGKIVDKMTDEIGAALMQTVHTYRPEEERIRAPTLSFYAFIDGETYQSSEMLTSEQKAQIVAYFRDIHPPLLHENIVAFAGRVPHAQIIEVPNSHHYCFLYNEELVYQAMHDFYTSIGV